MYTEEQLLPLSSVSEFVHCSRRCGLKLLEREWGSNVFTVEGDILHEKAHSGAHESRKNLKIIRNLRLRSLRLGITGITDVVELHRCTSAEGGTRIPGVSGMWKPLPVEYKRGGAKGIRCYEVQLCAQALCLEEMLSTHIVEGALFLGKKQHRTPVIFDDALRTETEGVCCAVQKLFATGMTPPADYNKRCISCSLFEVCLPKLSGRRRSTARWLNRQLDELCSGRDSETLS